MNTFLTCDHCLFELPSLDKSDIWWQLLYDVRFGDGKLSEYFFFLRMNRSFICGEAQTNFSFPIANTAVCHLLGETSLSFLPPMLACYTTLAVACFSSVLAKGNMEVNAGKLHMLVQCHCKLLIIFSLARCLVELINVVNLSPIKRSFHLHTDNSWQIQTLPLPQAISAAVLRTIKMLLSLESCS